MGFSVATKLNTGASIPLLGLGTFQAPAGEVGEAVKAAVKIGYRHIDCAHCYGNEKEVGEALKELFDSGVVKREDLWITSKLWNTDHDDVEKALNVTLKHLQLDYLDLYLIHWPIRMVKDAGEPADGVFLRFNIKEVWPAMEKLNESGKARSIGVSNFTAKRIEDMLTFAKIPPSVNQVECHPMWRQNKLRSFLDAHGIHLSAYAPLGSGGSVFVARKVLQHPVVKQIAEKHGRTPAQVALRWGIQVGNGVLPKSLHAERLKENADIFDWEMSSEDIEALHTIEEHRLFSGAYWAGYETSEFATVESVWDGEGL